MDADAFVVADERRKEEAAQHERAREGTQREEELRDRLLNATLCVGSHAQYSPFEAT